MEKPILYFRVFANTDLSGTLEEIMPAVDKQLGNLYSSPKPSRNVNLTVYKSLLLKNFKSKAIISKDLIPSLIALNIFNYHKAKENNLLPKKKFIFIDMFLYKNKGSNYKVIVQEKA